MRPSLLLALSFFLAPFGAHSQDRFEIDYAGVKLRFKAKWPEKFFGDKLGLALNIELSRIPGTYEPNVWGSGPLAGHQ